MATGTRNGGPSGQRLSWQLIPSRGSFPTHTKSQPRPIDLDNYPRALDHGKASLRLLPENPPLLIQLANVQVLLEGHLAEAKRSAQEGLELLEQMAGPSSVARKAWPNLQRQLRASGLYALGRAAATAAGGARADRERTALWQECERILSHAQSLNPSDPEIAYLMGLSFFAQGKRKAAVRSFLDAYREEGPLKSRALGYLRKIYETSQETGRVGFEDFLEVVENSRSVSVSRPLSPGSPPRTQSHGWDYAGTETCRRCHADKHTAWSQTGMGRMFRPYRAENILGGFGPNSEFYAGDEVRFLGDKVEVKRGATRFLYARMIMNDDRHYFQIRLSAGQWRLYPVDYTIGSKWQQAYATRLSSGQIHVFPIQYNTLEKRWVNFWKLIDPPGTPRTDVRSWEKHEAHTSYLMNCAVCHTSQLRNVSGGGFETGNREFREPGINCEMCHGPSAKHAAAMMEERPYEKQPLEPPVDFQKISSQDYVAICAQCHMQSAMRKPGSKGELNYSRHGDVFFPRAKNRPYAEFSNKVRYKDGRFRETTFVVESLLRSACFKKGQVNCGHCHNPHPENALSNPNSLRFADQPDRMCLQCHSSFAENIETHTRHPADSEASRCSSCHMPRIMNALLFRPKTHRIDDIPDAEMTVRFGQEESPNACLICHKDKGVSWLAQQLPGRIGRG